MRCRPEPSSWFLVESGRSKWNDRHPRLPFFRYPQAAIRPMPTPSRGCSAYVSITSLILLFACGILWGCNSRGDLAAVRGKITLDSQPLPDAFVVFSPVSHGTTSYGKTDAGGNYE